MFRWGGRGQRAGWSSRTFDQRFLNSWEKKITLMIQSGLRKFVAAHTKLPHHSFPTLFRFLTFTKNFLVAAIQSSQFLDYPKLDFQIFIPFCLDRRLAGLVFLTSFWIFPKLNFQIHFIPFLYLLLPNFWHLSRLFNVTWPTWGPNWPPLIKKRDVTHGGPQPTF